MHIQGKALYNLLRQSFLQDPSIPIEHWKIEDYRKLSVKELWNRLKELGLNLDEKHFLLYAENAESPEDLTEFLWLKDEDVEGQDRVYLIVFELWRRLLSKKQSLSLFCDELDYQIDRYLAKDEQVEESLQNSLSQLEDILDQNTDQERDPNDIFYLVSQYCAHDLNSFLYDYISEQIDKQNDLFASELIDGFSEYLPEVKWLDFLRARLFYSTDDQNGVIVTRRLIEQIQEDPDFDLLLEIADFLMDKPEEDLFFQSIKQALSLVQQEEDFQEAIAILLDHYQFLDKTKERLILKDLLSRRAEFSLEQKIIREDRDLQIILKLLEDEALL